MKRFIIILLMLLICTSTTFAENETKIQTTLKGVIENLSYEEVSPEVAQTKQIASVKLTNSGLKGTLINVENLITGNPYYDIKLKKRMRVLLHAEEINDELNISIESIDRSSVLVWLSLLFCGLLIYVGKKKGLYSLVSIVLTCILIFNILSPMILFGINPILATLIICLISTALTMYLVGGLNKKSSSATLGCILSIIFAGILALITARVAHLTGFNDEYSMFLYSAQPQLNFVFITISTIILATLGAVMDVAMSIASTINEIYTVDNSKTIKELFICGMNVGKDIIGTMANTLILVYLGASLPLLLLASNIDLQKFFNLNQVVTEIASALIGSCAIVICVPLTAIIASRLIKSTEKNTDFDFDE